MVIQAGWYGRTLPFTPATDPLDSKRNSEEKYRTAGIRRGKAMDRSLVGGVCFCLRHFASRRLAHKPVDQTLVERVRLLRHDPVPCGKGPYRAAGAGGEQSTS